MKKLIGLYGHMVEPGTYSEHIIRHDDWCRHFNGKPCNCDPDIVFKPSEHELEEATKSKDHSWTVAAFNPQKVH